MSRYDAEPNTAAEYAGREAFAPGPAPFLPTTDQSGGRNVRQPSSRNICRGAKARQQFFGRSRIGSHSAHTCTACSISFPNNYQLEQHAVKNKHKAHLCSWEKAFTKLSVLRHHIEESTQAREHRCRLCDAEFKRPGHGEQHLRLIRQRSKDAIKDLLSGQKSQPHQEPGQAITDSAAVGMIGSMDAQAVYQFVLPNAPWTGPIDFSAMAPAGHTASRPADISAFFSGFPASDMGLVTATPAFPLQNFVTQAPELPAYGTYPAGGMATQTGLPFNAALDFVGYPAAHLDRDLGLLYVDRALVSVNPAGGFGLPGLEIDFVGELIGFNLNTFDY